MFTIPCVLFAGGKSSRMGTNKALLPFGGFTTLAEFQYRRLQTMFENVYISTKDATLFNFDAQCIIDQENFDLFAPTVGFYSMFTQLDSERIFILSVDTPFVDSSVIEQLIQADTLTNDATIAKTPQGIHPLIGVYHRSLLPKIETMLVHNDHRLGAMLAASHTMYLFFEDEAPFLNLNHPHEYELARQLYPC